MAQIDLSRGITILTDSFMKRNAKFHLQTRNNSFIRPYNKNYIKSSSLNTKPNTIKCSQENSHSLSQPFHLQTLITILMQGGLFGLSTSQKSYLYIALFIPSLIVYLNQDLITIFALLQLFYLVSSVVYIKFLSIEKQLYPYLFYQNNKLSKQIEKGFSLAVSGFLLITLYGILFLKIGRVALPHTIEVGENIIHHFWVFALLLLINPLLEEWFWRLFQPKTFQQNYEKNWIINITYLVFHLMLFYRYLGFWRALPLVTLVFSLGRSMSHIKSKYGIWSAVITHYGITVAGCTLFFYIKWFTDVKIV